MIGDNSKLTTIQVYSDILNGYSKINLDGSFVYIKHHGPRDECIIEKIKLEYFNRAIDKKIPTETERLEELTKQKFWTEEKELEIRRRKNEIENATNTKKGAFLISQINQRDKEIKELRDVLDILEFEKSILVGLTAEKYAESKASNYYIYYSLFKDPSFKESLYTKEEFDQLDEYEIQSLIKGFNDGISFITVPNIKKTAISSIFQSAYTLSESASDFMGIPVSKFTYYQNSLLSYGAYYKTILSELADKIDEKYKTDPEKLESIYISSKNIQKDKEKNPNRQNVEYFGATEEDDKLLGKDYSKEEIEMKLLQEKGSISMEDMIKYGLT